MHVAAGGRQLFRATDVVVMSGLPAGTGRFTGRYNWGYAVG